MKVIVQQVIKSFNKAGSKQVLALENINLNIKQGEFVCLLGPSGCGKTTLLNIIAGLEAADSGWVYIDHQPVAGAGADRVVVFQEAALFPWLNVQKNVEFGLKMQGVKPEVRQDIANQYLEMVHLGDFAQAYPHELSGGMKQRVAIARALAMDPKILLMDEPFAALDAQTRAMLHKDLQQLWQQTGKTIIFVTHNVAEATCLADRVILLSARPGRIKKEFKIKVPRPRNENELLLQGYQHEIMEMLGEELNPSPVIELDNIVSLEVKKLASTLE